MAKSSRRRKLDRARRETTAAQRRTATQRRRGIAELNDTFVATVKRVLDPATPASELAGLIDFLYADRPVPIWLVPAMLDKGQPAERMSAVAEAMLAGPADAGSADADAGTAHGKPRPSVTALTFAAAVARSFGNASESRHLLDQALAAAEESDNLWDMIDHLRRAGRVAEALGLLEVRLREQPGDEHVATLYGNAIDAAFDRAGISAPGDDGTCTCGLGTSWRECCKPKERGALDRFSDRSGLEALQGAIGTWLATSGYGIAVDTWVADAMPPEHDLDWNAADRSGLIALLTERALLTVRPGDSEEDQGVDDLTDDDFEDDGTLAAIAADPETAADLASRALAWRDHVHYGLWRIDSPEPAPGLWCTEIVSGRTRYVEFPAGIATPPRWAVWMGAVVPVDGIWRCTGVGMRLGPAEADAAAELVADAANAVARRLAGKSGRTQPRAREPMRFGRADPVGVLVDFDDPAPPESARLIGLVTGELMAGIATEVHDYRTAPPALRNTDGDPMCMITARIEVSDGRKAAGHLAGRPDFEPDRDDPSAITWYGARIPDEQAKAMMAQALAQLRADGRGDAELTAPDSPQRWVRGTLRVDGDQILVEVNSAERLGRLITVLELIGANPLVVDQKRIDPAQDLPWPGGERAVPGGAVSAADGWEKFWLDEPVPALRGRTPRQAAEGRELPLLEALLRQWEYEADLLAAAGKRGIDTEWLRHELGMDAADEFAAG